MRGKYGGKDFMRETDMIRIGKPYIEETKSDVNENGGIRLCAEVSMSRG